MRWTLIILILVGGHPLFGQEAASEVDFGKGLEELGRLGGLPEMRGAKWIKPRSASDQNDGPYELSELGMKGNGWEFMGEPELLLFGRCELPVREADEAPADPEEEPAEPAAKPGPAVIQESFAKEDAAKLSAALRNPERAKQYASRLQYGDGSFIGRCLVFAVQLNAAGEKAAANELAAALFALTPQKSAVIDAAIGQFAGDAYEQTTARFFEDYNWQAYLDDLKKLLVKFPRGWAEGSGVALLVPAVERRASGAAVAKPALAGIELKPAALDALQRLLAAPEKQEISDEELAERFGASWEDVPASQRRRFLAMMRSQMGRRSGYESSHGSELWLLAEASKEASDPVTQLKGMGMDGLIALAAVATDETLIPQPGGATIGHGSRFSDSPTPEAIYSSLNRPRSRGELARELLAQVVPMGETRGLPDAEQVRHAAIAFWNGFRTKPALALGAHFLVEGNSQQIQQAAAYLAASADPAAHAVFEKAVMEGETAAFLSEVDLYLSKRGPAAAGFFKEFAQALRERSGPSDGSQVSYEVREAGGIDKYLRGMGLKVGAFSLTEIIEEALKPVAQDLPDESDPFIHQRGMNSRSEISKLGMTLANVPMAECLQAFGAAAPKATPAQLADICELLLTRAIRGTGQAERKAPAEPLPAEVLELWRPLLANKSPIPDSQGLSESILANESFGDLAAMVLEAAAFPGSWHSFSRICSLSESPAEGTKFLRERVEAWMAGKDPPAWPEAESVSAERKNEIAAKLGSLPAAEIAPFAAALSMTERLALTRILGEYDAGNPPPAGLRELQTMVTSVVGQNTWLKADAPLLQKASVAKGWVISEENIEKLINHAASDLKGFNDLAASASPHEARLRSQCGAQ